MKTIVVFGAGGFIGGNLSKRLIDQGHRVIGADIKEHEYLNIPFHEFYKVDLTDIENVRQVIGYNVDELYQLAADMGGITYITGNNNADIMSNSVRINLNTAQVAVEKGVKKLFYSSSACVYPEHNQLDPNNPMCVEDSVYPADPDTEYGWEKLFSERLYESYRQQYGLNIRVARFHNIFGPYGTYKGGKEKAPAALCRKIIECKGSIDIIGDGKQTRSFLFIDDCLDAMELLMQSDYYHPINIGSEDMVTIKQLADIIKDISAKDLIYQYIKGPQGVRGRNSDNTLIRKVLNWEPKVTLQEGLVHTYIWITTQIN